MLVINFIQKSQSQLTIQKQLMLKYREFLQQSRALRGQTQYPVHYQIPNSFQIKSNQNIKQFVSNPGYGQIFYSQNNKSKEQQLNQHLNSSLKIQLNRSQEIKGYIDHLQQENAMLKSKLSQVQQLPQIQQSHFNSIDNLDSRANLGKNQFVDGGYEGNFGSSDNIEPQYITSQLPSQNNVWQHPATHDSHPSFNQRIKQHHKNFVKPIHTRNPSETLLSMPNSPGAKYAFKPSYTQNQQFIKNPPQHIQQNPQARTQANLYSHPQHQQIPYKKNQNYPIQEQEQEHECQNQYENQETNYLLRQTTHTNPNPNLSYNQNQYVLNSPHTALISQNNIPYRESFPIYGSRPGIQSPHGNSDHRPSNQTIWTLAKQKLNNLKDDDQELRAYTIKLLKKGGS